MRLRGAIRLARVQKLRSDERGFTLVEVSVAMLVMSIAVLGVIGSMGMGLTLVGHSRQRSSASAVAQERLERARSIPYERIATYEQPTHNPDQDHPDYRVTTPGNANYQVEDGPTEPLIVDLVDGALKHLDDPVEIGNTEFTVHQYVTWVDDASVTGTQDYKRVTAVVTWKFPVQTGVTRRVFFSTFVSDGTVSVPTPTPSGSPGPSPSSTPGPPLPTPTPGTCPGDVTPPTGTMQVLSGAGAVQGYTNSTTVQVRLDATDPCSVITGLLSNDGSLFSPVATVPSGGSTTATWTISGVVDGAKTIYVKFRDGNGNTSAAQSSTLILDQAKPTTPGNLRKSACSLHGTERTVTLTWDAASDDNLLGYRLYRSIDSAAFQSVTTTTGTSVSDTTAKSLNSVRYIVRAYDRAGNESEDSNAISYSKNSC